MNYWLDQDKVKLANSLAETAMTIYQSLLQKLDFEALPGSQNLGEQDDMAYFRNKVFNSLGLPEHFFKKP